MNDENKQSAIAVDDLPSPTLAPLHGKRTQIANAGYVNYAADPSAVNLQLFRDSLSTLAYGVVKYLVSDTEWDEYAAIAADHCLAQFERGKYTPKPTAEFSTWAAKVMRRKVYTVRRDVKRAEARKARHEAKQERRPYEEFVRRQQEHKRNQFEFTEDEVERVTGQLKLGQAKLLELKARKLENGLIARQLDLTLPQLHNRWARLRKKIASLLTPKRLWLNRNVGSRPRWYPGAPSYTPLRKINR
jgi:DNA-directed RNA polymerase specialized sigma24 family protein